MDITDSRIHVYLNGCFSFSICMILGRSVYNDFSKKFRYLYEITDTFRDLWKNTPMIKAYKNMTLT